VGDSEKATHLAEKLLNAGFHVGAIRPPTVAKGTARLRITLNANQFQQDAENTEYCLII
jgi:8-amino-7-oxononanoate synthase